MVEIYSVVSIVTGIILLTITLLKLKKQTIQQGTFVIWLGIGVVAILIGAVPFSIELIASLLGTQLTVSAILGSATIFLTILVFYLHNKTDNLNQRITKLVAELAANRFYKQSSDDPETKTKM